MADNPTTDGATAATDGDITASYTETAGERRLSFNRKGQTAVVAQNSEGYAMLRVRETAESDELERYYGFDMALDHAAELLGVDPNALPVPEAATDMGM
jgi:hypothetical protein